MQQRTAKVFDILFPIALFFGSLFLTYRFAIIEFDPHHTGLMYKTALDLAHGKVLFLETFTQYGALVSYIQAWGILLFGERVTSILFVTAIAYAADYTLFYALARRFFGRGVSAALSVCAIFLAPFWFWAFHPWASVFSLFFIEMATLCCLQAIKSAHAPLFAGFAGVAAGLAFWCRQPVGIVSLLACAIVFSVPAVVYRKKDTALSRRFLKSLPAALGAAAATVGVGLLLLARAGMLYDFYCQSIRGMFRFAADRADATKYAGFGAVAKIFFCLVLAPFNVGECMPLDIFWVLLPACSVAVFVQSVRRILADVRGKREDDAPERTRALAVFTVFSVASWHQYYPVFCYRHWYWGGMMSLIPAMVLALQLGKKCLNTARVRAFAQRGKQKLRRTLVLAFIPCLLLVPNVAWRAARGAAKLAHTREQVVMANEHYKHLNGLSLDAAVAAHYNAYFDNIWLLHTVDPDRNVVNITENGIYAVCGENFCPMFVSFGDFYYDEYEEWLNAYLRAERPIVVGPACPSGYVLWRAAEGETGDPAELYHDLPANISLPIEFYETLPENLK